MSADEAVIETTLRKLEKIERSAGWFAVTGLLLSSVFAVVAVVVGSQTAVRGLPELMHAFSDQQREAIEHFVSGQVQGQWMMSLAYLFIFLATAAMAWRRTNERKALIALLRIRAAQLT